MIDFLILVKEYVKGIEPSVYSFLKYLIHQHSTRPQNHTKSNMVDHLHCQAEIEPRLQYRYYRLKYRKGQPPTYCHFSDRAVPQAVFFGLYSSYIFCHFECGFMAHFYIQIRSCNGFFGFYNVAVAVIRGFNYCFGYLFQSVK